MGEWTDRQWKRFIAQHQVEGGTVARVPVSVYVHCRQCGARIDRGRSPMMQLYYCAEDSSSILCVSCARHQAVIPVRLRQEERAAWMRFEPLLEPKHIGG